MKIAKYWHKENQLVNDNENKQYNIVCWAGSDTSEEEAKEKALAKMQNWISRLAKGVQSLDDYEYQNNEIREELIEEIYNDNQQLIAAITRNRYGALVLNTDAVVIADVDVPSRTFTEFFLGLFGKKTDKAAQYLVHIKACHAHYPQLNFIIYETFAGFRVVITGHHHSPSDAQTTALFAKLKTDKLYATLCRVQDCFRARLTPKPWRCHSPLPPHRFPRLDEQQSAFANWLQVYEKNSDKYAVCYKVIQLGKQSIPDDIDKIISLHDDYVLKRRKLPLA